MDMWSSPSYGHTVSVPMGDVDIQTKTEIMDVDQGDDSSGHMGDFEGTTSEIQNDKGLLEASDPEFKMEDVELQKSRRLSSPKLLGHLTDLECFAPISPTSPGSSPNLSTKPVLQNPVPVPLKKSRSLPFLNDRRSSCEDTFSNTFSNTGDNLPLGDAQVEMRPVRANSEDMCMDRFIMFNVHGPGGLRRSPEYLSEENLSLPLQCESEVFASPQIQVQVAGADDTDDVTMQTSGLLIHRLDRNPPSVVSQVSAIDLQAGRHGNDHILDNLASPSPLLQTAPEPVEEDYVIYGSTEVLISRAQRWLADRKAGNWVTDDQWDGVILEHMARSMEVVDGQYELEEEWDFQHSDMTGSGTFGQCYRASDVNTEYVFCAKKVLLKDFEIRELSVLANLDHPGIVKLYGALRNDAYIYILMEYVHGDNLQLIHDHMGCLDISEALGYTQQLLEIVAYLHDNGVVHEDIKPGNIMVDKVTSEVKLVDFGSTNVIQPGDYCTTLDTGVPGTTAFWSPNKARGLRWGLPADVWAVIASFLSLIDRRELWQRVWPGIDNHYSLTFKLGSIEGNNEVQRLLDLVMPCHLDLDAQDFVHQGWTMDPVDRATATQLLSHPVFTVMANRQAETDDITVGTRLSLDNRTCDIFEPQHVSEMS